MDTLPICSTYYHMYDGTVVSEAQPSESVLDPIPPHLPGCLLLPRNRVDGRSPIGKTMGLLYQPDEVRSMLHQGLYPVEFKPSATENLRFVDELLGVGLAIKKASRSQHDYGFARLFTVLKRVGDDGVGLLRTILDCWGANDRFIDPLPVNLPTVPLMTTLFAYVEKMRTLDLRHMYHQIPIGEHLWPWFTIAMRSLRLQWTCLPMGWKWACFAAQAVITYACAGEMAWSWTSLPRAMEFGSVKVVCVYDNVICGGPADEVDAWWQGFLDRLGTMSAVVKEEAQATAGGFVDALGIRWYPSVEGLRWELLPTFQKKLDQTGSLFRIPQPVTAKNIAGALGQLAWAAYAMEGTLFRVQPAYLRLAKVVSANGWNAVDSSEHYPDIVVAIQEVLSAGPQRRTTEVLEDALVYSDAHVTGYGFIVVQPLVIRSKPWKEVFTSRDMYYLEAIAAKQAVSTTCKDAVRVCLAVDNKALMHAINKRATACPRTARVLAELFEILKRSGSGINMGWIPTANNPADELSRGYRLSGAKLVAAPAFVQWTSPCRFSLGWAHC